MKEVSLRLKIFLVLFSSVTVIGTIGFMLLEDLSLNEALYYNIVTMSTVGYGDIHPTGPASRLFAVLLIVMGGATFLGVIANTTEIIILKRETQKRMKKVNMILSVFFSEVAYNLIRLFSKHDQTTDTIRDRLLVGFDWPAKRFADAQKFITKHVFQIDPTCLDLEKVCDLLSSRRDFLVGLLENPVLIEHDDFSETLLAVFHLLDELCSRDGLQDLPVPDLQHIVGDMDRAYKKLIHQWLFYMNHLKEQYPYLFSLAVRKNPFDPNASAVISG